MVSQQNKPHGKVQYFLVRWIDDTFPPGAPLFLGNRRMPAPTCTYQKALPWPIDRSWPLGFCRRFASGFYAIHGIVKVGVALRLVVVVLRWFVMPLER